MHAHTCLSVCRGLNASGVFGQSLLSFSLLLVLSSFTRQTSNKHICSVSRRLPFVWDVACCDVLRLFAVWSCRCVHVPGLRLKLKKKQLMI